MKRAFAFIGLLTLAVAPGCGDSAAPGLDGPSYFTITLDGTPWVPDTAVGIFFGTSPDSGTLDLFAERGTANSGETVALVIRDLPPPGILTLGDSSSQAIGVYIVTGPAGGPPTQPLTFYSTPAAPGSLRITALSRSDSVVAGSFSFRAVTNPDTAPHHRLSGRFRVHYTFQQIYLPALRVSPRR